MSTTPHPDTFMPALRAVQQLKRRSFLHAGASVLALGSLTSVGALAAGTPGGLKFQSEAEAAVFFRIAQVSLPTQGTQLTPWTAEGLLGTLDAALLAGMEPHVLAGLKGGVQYFNEGPQATLGQRFTALDDAQAARFLDEWAASAVPPQRALAMGLKKLVQLSYWANPATWPPLGYGGPLTRQRGFKQLGNAPMPR